MTIVVGTAGHIDHGKTTLLRALTGIDADRLPEERRRGMTIDVGYAHLTFDDGTELDFVDVPGHDRLVGNMLVGAGEIDAAMLVVAADDGPRAQTREHLALLDALDIDAGLAVVTKAGLAGPARVAEVMGLVRDLLAGTSLAAVPVLAVDSVSGEGLDEVRTALRALADAAPAVSHGSPGTAGSRLAIDRVFGVKGRGTVVTGSLRGDPVTRGATLRAIPGGASVRVRELQVHGHTVEMAGPGRTAFNVTGDATPELRRGVVLATDDVVTATSRLLVRLRRRLPDRARARLHLGTDATDAVVGRSGRDAIDLPDGDAAVLRLTGPVAAAPGDRFLLRRSGPDPIVGGVVLDVAPARGASRRRQTRDRVAALDRAVGRGGHGPGDPVAAAAARLDLHGVDRAEGVTHLAPDVAALATEVALATVASVVGTGTGTPRTAVRTVLERTIRQAATVTRADATILANRVLDEMLRRGDLRAEGEVLRLPGAAAPAEDPARAAAMDRLEAALAVLAPPPLHEAARAAGCPPDAVRELERRGRLVVLEPDLAFAMTTYRDLAAAALRTASAAPLTPAAFRDATGTSRKYVMPILEDLDRRGILRRTPDGHVPGPRASRDVALR